MESRLLSWRGQGEVLSTLQPCMLGRFGRWGGGPIRSHQTKHTPHTDWSLQESNIWAAASGCSQVWGCRFVSHVLTVLMCPRFRPACQQSDPLPVSGLLRLVRRYRLHKLWIVSRNVHKSDLIWINRIIFQILSHSFMVFYVIFSFLLHCRFVKFADGAPFWPEHKLRRILVVFILSPDFISVFVVRQQREETSAGGRVTFSIINNHQ